MSHALRIAEQVFYNPSLRDNNQKSFSKLIPHDEEGIDLFNAYSEITDDCAIESNPYTMMNGAEQAMLILFCELYVNE